ncbi:MAG: hypothetical protein ACLFTR_02740 [Candidatus Woesearchaeota archaeon]
MGSGDMRKFYEEYAKTYTLPPYDIVDKELELSSSDGDKFALRTIRSKIKGKVDNHASMIEDMLNPDTSISSLHECTYITETRKKKMFNLYQKLMYMLRTADLLDIEKSMEQDAKYISMYFKHLHRLKKEMREIASLRMNTWKKEISPYVKEEYFG